MAISAVINTRNAEKTLKRCLQSLVWVDEVVVMDMESSDQTVSLAKTFTNTVYSTANKGYVEPARNEALGKVRGEWILIIDADEEVSKSLAAKIQSLTKGQVSHYRLPRKNIIFHKWIQHGLWWPDYQIRLFRKGAVEWREEIHSVPYTYGVGEDLPPTEENAIIHYNYSSIEEFIDRLNRYTTTQAKELVIRDKEFSWQKILTSPFDEFLRRYFMAEGYKDGLHGFVLATFQAFSQAVVQSKVWQNHKFKEISQKEVTKEFKDFQENKQRELYFWMNKTHMKSTIWEKMQKIFS